MAPRPKGSVPLGEEGDLAMDGHIAPWSACALSSAAGTRRFPQGNTTPRASGTHRLCPNFGFAMGNVSTGCLPFADVPETLARQPEASTLVGMTAPGGAPGGTGQFPTEGYEGYARY